MWLAWLESHSQPLFSHHYLGAHLQHIMIMISEVTLPYHMWCVYLHACVRFEYVYLYTCMDVWACCGCVWLSPCKYTDSQVFNGTTSGMPFSFSPWWTIESTWGCGEHGHYCILALFFTPNAKLVAPLLHAMSSSLMLTADLCGFHCISVISTTPTLSIWHYWLSLLHEMWPNNMLDEIDPLNWREM